MAPRERTISLSALIGRGPASEASDPPATAGRESQRQNERRQGENRSAGVAADSIEGKVTGVTGRVVTGWVWDPARPYEPLGVEAFVRNTRVGHGLADHFDLELARRKLGNGMHRFEIGLERLPLGQPPFVLRFVVANTDIELGPPITLSTVEDAERLLCGNEYRGRITDIAQGLICGWVMNRRNPHERPLLTLHDADRALVTQLAGEVVPEAVEAGVVANVYRFELPLPASLADGTLHRLSVTAGDTGAELDGSPILFGPTDVNSLSRELIAISERLQKMDQRIELLGPAADATHLQNQIAARILDRLDMLLNIHRDSVERELAVMRRQMNRLLQHIPDTESDVIVSHAEPVLIEDEAIPPPATFSLATRAVPLLNFDLTVPDSEIEITKGVQRSASDAGLQIAGDGTIELGESVAAPASLVFSGKGARNPFEFCELMVLLDGYPISGRVDFFEGDKWKFTGSTISNSIGKENAIRVAFLGRGQPKNPLTLDNIAVFGHGRAPLHSDESPSASLIYLGTELLGSGWHGAEASGHGAICWMGTQSETLFEVRPARSYTFVIPEIRPLTPDIMTQLQISIGGVPAKFTAAPLRQDSAAFSIDGHCLMPEPEEVGSPIVFRITFPREFVRSPMELGLNSDARPLTIAVRAIGLRASD